MTPRDVLACGRAAAAIAPDAFRGASSVSRIAGMTTLTIPLAPTGVLIVYVRADDTYRALVEWAGYRRRDIEEGDVLTSSAVARAALAAQRMSIAGQRTMRDARKRWR